VKLLIDILLKTQMKFIHHLTTWTLIVVLLLSYAITLLHAQTIIQDITQETTLVQAKSPFQIPASISVTARLIIEPGVIVQLGDNVGK
jgi:hypothetical protein